LDFYSASSLKQQSAGRHVAPLGHIILIPSHSAIALSPECCVLSGEATNTNFDLTGARTHDLPYSRRALNIREGGRWWLCSVLKCDWEVEREEGDDCVLYLFLRLKSEVLVVYITFCVWNYLNFITLNEKNSVLLWYILFARICITIALNKKSHICKDYFFF
jgi:hypothetical protein